MLMSTSGLIDESEVNDDGQIPQLLFGSSPLIGQSLRIYAQVTDHSKEYGCTLTQMRNLMEARGAEAVVRLSTEHNGVDGLCAKLRVDPVRGLPNQASELERRRAAFGANTIPPGRSKSFFRLLYDACRDPTLIILVVAGFVNLALSFYEPDVKTSEDETTTLDGLLASDFISNGTIGLDLINATLASNSTVAHTSEGHGTAWIEGCAILLCVVVVVLVTAINDYSKERQFRSLQEKIETGQKFSVIRDGEAIDVPVSDLVVGDIARVKYGDLIPADGFLIQGNDLKVRTTCKQFSPLRGVEMGKGGVEGNSVSRKVLHLL
uniref:Cation_ATPase_N domain-containing protein n=1 Tax=Angiostrongylus cantonensis TaxID=6313 RepID=A0A0K0CZK4_ANGCA